MSLLDDLRNLLARHLAHVQSGTNQGVARLIEDHLARLEAVVSADEAAAEAKVHEVLGELYAATNAPAPAADQTPPAPPVVGEPGPAPVDSAPAPSPDPVAAPVDAAPTPEPAPAPAEATDSPA